MPAFIGIDFGNSFCRVGVWQNGQASIVVDEMGLRQVATYVSFADDGRKVMGDTAKRQASRRLKNTYFDLKVMLGKDFAGVAEASAAARWPFAIEEGPNGALVLTPETAAGSGGKGKGNSKANPGITAVSVTQSFLAKLKAIAEAGIGEIVDRAVISVPADFSETQRAALCAAAKGAGLHVMSLLHEPAAAAVALGLDAYLPEHVVTAGNDADEEDNEAEVDATLSSSSPRTVVVYDLGGRGLSVTVLTVVGGVISMSSSVRAEGVGGDALDDVVFKMCCKMFTRKYRGMDLTESKRSVGKLMCACEEVRRTLSTAQRAGINVESLHEGLDFADFVTRARLEGDCMPMLQRTLVTVDQALADAGVEACDVDQVLLAGGCSRTPAVRRLLVRKFGEERVSSCDLAPFADEVVALGCVTHAARLAEASGEVQAGEGTGDESKMTKEVKSEERKCAEGGSAESKTTSSQEAVSLTLGVVTAEGGVQPVISRGALLPAVGELDLSEGVVEGVVSEPVLVTIVEGNRPLAKDNHVIASFPVRLGGAASAASNAAGSSAPVCSSLTFLLSQDGSLRVVRPTGNGGEEEVLSVPSSMASGFGPTEVAAALDDVKSNIATDRSWKSLFGGRKALQSYCTDELDDECLSDIEEDDLKTLQALRESTQQWLTASTLASPSDLSPGEVSTKVVEILARIADLQEKVGEVLAQYEEDEEEAEEDVVEGGDAASVLAAAAVGDGELD